MLKNAFLTFSEFFLSFYFHFADFTKIIRLGVVIQISPQGKIIKLWLFLVVYLLDKVSNFCSTGLTFQNKLMFLTST